MHIHKDELTIEGRREVVREGAVHAEYPGWNFRRSFRLPGGLNHDKVAAELKQGVLTLHLPKADALKPRRITVRGS